MPDQRRLTYLKPITTRVQTAIEFVEGSFSSLAETIESSLPDGRERELALRNLEDSFHWACQAVLKNQGHYSPDLKEGAAS